MANEWGDEPANEWGDLPAAAEAAPSAVATSPGSSLSRWSQKVGEGLVPGFNRITAAAQAATDALIPGRTDEWGSDFSTRYAEHLAANRSQSDSTAAEAPIRSALLQTAGAIPSALATGAPLGVLPSAAGAGAAYAAGDTRSTDVAGQALDVALGAGMGAAASKIPNALMAVENAVRGSAGRLAPSLSRVAETAAVRSANADRTATRRAFKGDDAARRELGRFMLEEDVPLRSPRGIRDAAREIADQAGPEIGAIAQAADQAGAQVDLAAAVTVAKAARQVAVLNKNTVTRNAYDQIVGMLDDQLTQHGGRVSPSTAHDIRMQLDQLANWDQAAPKQVQSAWRAARGAIDDALDQSVAGVGLGDAWATANARFSQARKLANPSKRGLADIGTERREGNRLGSPSEKAAGVAGMITAAIRGPVAGAAIPAATVAFNRYSMPVAARSADALSRFLSAPRLQAPSMSPLAPRAATPSAVANITPAMRRFVESFGQSKTTASSRVPPEVAEYVSRQAGSGFVPGGTNEEDGSAAQGGADRLPQPLFTPELIDFVQRHTQRAWAQ